MGKERRGDYESRTKGDIRLSGCCTCCRLVLSPSTSPERNASDASTANCSKCSSPVEDIFPPGFAVVDDEEEEEEEAGPDVVGSIKSLNSASQWRAI